MVASVSRVDDVAPVPRLPLHDDDSMDLSIRFKTPGSQGFELVQRQRSSLAFNIWRLRLQLHARATCLI